MIIMDRATMIDTLMRARNILARREQGIVLSSGELVIAQDCVDIVVDALVDENFKEKYHVIK